ncbi:unnamed protein product, partial [Allacma fusca]
LGPLDAAFKLVKNPKDELQELIVKFIILTDQPFSVVEAEAFLNLCNYNRIKPLSIPKRDAIRQKIQSIYECEKQEIVKMLKATSSKISL